VQSAQRNYTYGVCQDRSMQQTSVSELGLADFGAPLLTILLMAFVSLGMTRCGHTMMTKTTMVVKKIEQAAIEAADLDGDGSLRASTIRRRISSKVVRRSVAARASTGLRSEPSSAATSCPSGEVQQVPHSAGDVAAALTSMVDDLHCHERTVNTHVDHERPAEASMDHARTTDGVDEVSLVI
jgi:hypothetical protein